MAGSSAKESGGRIEITSGRSEFADSGSIIAQTQVAYRSGDVLVETGYGKLSSGDIILRSGDSLDGSAGTVDFQVGRSLDEAPSLSIIGGSSNSQTGSSIILMSGYSRVGS